MKSRLQKFSTHRAFTRTDLLFAALAACVLVGTTHTLVGGNKSGSDLAVCFNNLRQIGIGFEAAKENYPDTWWFNVSHPEGGIWQTYIYNQPWFQMMYVSNYLASPKVLACPADKSVRVAATWSSAPGGLLHVSLRNAAISYTLSPHARPFAGKSILCTDRNIRFTSVGNNCSYANGLFSTASSGSVETRWTNEIHGLTGHVLTTDGTVTFTTSMKLQEMLKNSSPESDTNGGPSVNVHFAVPR